MPWFKVDDQMHSSRKLKSIPKRDRLAAVGLWTLAGSWSSQELTEGFIPEYMLDELGGTPRLAQALCDARAGSTHGLWKACAGGWRFHDWDHFNPSKEKVLDEREKARERQQRARDKARQKHVTDESRRDDAVTHAVTSPLVTGESQGESRPPRPDPTRPDPIKKEESGPRKRGARIKEDWLPAETTRRKMQDEYPAVDFRIEHEKFIDYWMSASGKNASKLDWDRTWCNWIRNAATTYAPRHLRVVGETSYPDEPPVVDGPPPELQKEGGLFD